MQVNVARQEPCQTHICIPLGLVVVLSASAKDMSQTSSSTLEMSTSPPRRLASEWHIFTWRDQSAACTGHEGLLTWGH